MRHKTVSQIDSIHLAVRQRMTQLPCQILSDSGAGAYFLHDHHMMPRGNTGYNLRYRQGRCLVYVYRPSLLRRDLAEEGAVRILRACGYPCARLKNICSADII